jgi:hypothetical protein
MGRGAAKLENPWAAPAPAPTLVDDAVVKEAEPEFRRVNLSCKWRDRVIELPGLDESLTIEDVKIIIEEETSVPAERVKLVGLKARVGRVNDDMRLADLVLKLPTQKVIVMGTPDEELLREPSSPVEIFDDLSDRPIQITKYTAWEWARCSRGELDGFNEDSGKPWKCVFVDTFLIDGPPDPTKWVFQTDCNAWVHDQHHRERQLYTDKENAHVKDGVLYIEARRDQPTPDLPYSSARLTTRDAAHGRWRYGRVEVCAKLPPGKPGLWPAIWMMPSRSVQRVNHALHAIDATEARFARRFRLRQVAALGRDRPHGERGLGARRRAGLDPHGPEPSATGQPQPARERREGRARRVPRLRVRLDAGPRRVLRGRPQILYIQERGPRRGAVALRPGLSLDPERGGRRRVGGAARY